MPVLENAVNTRFEILKTLYTLSCKEAGKEVRFYAAQIGGGYYSEIYHQLRFLQEKGMVNFGRNRISKRITAELTNSGMTFMEDAYAALKLEEAEKDGALTEIFNRIKV